MEVKMIAHTDAGESVCGVASKNCVSETMPELGDDDLLKSMKGAIASGHESVLEHWSATFAITGISRVTEIQLVRHRIGASYSIQSGRYCARDPTNYVIPFDPKDRVKDAIEGFNIALRNLDEELQFAGIKEEDRRYFYPQGLRTNIVCTFNGRELKHLFSLRCCARAQKEIRELANKMLEECIKVAPNIFSDAGPSCVQNGGFCVEGKRGCGLRPTMNELLSSYEESHGKDKGH